LSQVRGAQRLYLGNSLPIREWDLAAARNSEWSDCLGNRGANGIDGQVSTFLGWQSSEDHSLGFFGDLTAMYDLQALWSASPFRQGRALPRASICVMNNGGGQIFQRMFKKEIFLNQHQLHFQSWAEMFGWKYQALNQTAPLEWETGCIYEVNPSADETQSFWQEMDQYGY
jgi:2-succinyl-5-enolpyruvyl-6-hydroxy-3-cyclohexene-1-carboxylate synthase